MSGPTLDYDRWVELLEGGDRASQAMALALRYGQIDGDHHKAWVIDQMVRVLAGESGYDQLVEAFEYGGEYEWDEGIAP